ncbi:uncharacterized protein LOC115752712 isoform X2 [Rhodamnia argentea]|uniref:Uncharacterized protein LOC115752712 isoform X2 n=1 Tax=Rhodamnia argentea TaxID=178133 RepID=A0ABM3H408_9MYRT|nr:uncharacterized protein LOC115752712 isoform X2 [Rhodamnia argentea]
MTGRGNMGSGFKPSTPTSRPQVNEDLTSHMLNNECDGFIAMVGQLSNDESSNLPTPCTSSTTPVPNGNLQGAAYSGNRDSPSGSATLTVGDFPFGNMTSSVIRSSHTSRNSNSPILRGQGLHTPGVSWNYFGVPESSSYGNSVTLDNLMNSRPCVRGPLISRDYTDFRGNASAGLRTIGPTWATNVQIDHDSVVVSSVANGATNLQNSPANLKIMQANSSRGSQYLLQGQSSNKNTPSHQLMGNLKDQMLLAPLLNQRSDSVQVGEDSGDMSNMLQFRPPEILDGRLLTLSTGPHTEMSSKPIVSSSCSTQETGGGNNGQKGSLLHPENSTSVGSALLQNVDGNTVRYQNATFCSRHQEIRSSQCGNLHLQHCNGRCIYPGSGNGNLSLQGSLDMRSANIGQSHLVSSSKSPVSDHSVLRGLAQHGSTRFPSLSSPFCQNNAQAGSHALGNSRTQVDRNVSGVPSKSISPSNSIFSPRHGQSGNLGQSWTNHVVKPVPNLLSCSSAGALPSAVKQPELQQISNMPVGPSRKREAPQLPAATYNVVRRKTQPITSSSVSSSTQTAIPSQPITHSSVPTSRQTAKTLQLTTSPCIPSSRPTLTSLQPVTSSHIPSSRQNATPSQPIRQVALPLPLLAEQHRSIAGFVPTPQFVPAFPYPAQPMQYFPVQHQGALVQPHIQGPNQVAPFLPHQAQSVRCLSNLRQNSLPLASPHRVPVHPYYPPLPQHSPAARAGQTTRQIAQPSAPALPPRIVPWAARPLPGKDNSSALSAHIRLQVEDEASQLIGHKCFLCKRDLRYVPGSGPISIPSRPPTISVLPCGHTFHESCLDWITPEDQAKDPPCITCIFGED